MLCPHCNSAGCEEDCVEIEEEEKELRQKLHNTIDVMSLSQLRALTESLFSNEFKDEFDDNSIIW